jgi:glycosyltransferase involved in cell wall biosynthesis
LRSEPPASGSSQRRFPIDDRLSRGLVITSHRPIRVLLWSPSGSSERYHGPGSFAFRLYSLADPQETIVTLAHNNPRQPEVDLFRGQHYVAGKEGVLGTLTFLRRAKKWMAAHAKQFDVFHGLTAYHRTVPPAYYAHRLGLPAVVFVAGHGKELADKADLRRLLGWPRQRREMIRQVEGVIAMSRAIYEDLIECGVDPRRIARIPMGVNTERFRPCRDLHEKTEIRRTLGLPDRPMLLFVGSLTRNKQPHLLLEAVSRLRRQKLDCQLVLVGPAIEQDYEGEMQEFLRKEQLGDRVRMVGFTGQVELYHRAADIFALPSRSEGMPAAMVEAMSSGVACLGTMISGISDLIDSGYNGRIVQPTVDSLVEALTDCLREPAMVAEYGKRSRKQILKRYSASIVLNAYQELFRCVMDGRDACNASTLPDMDLGTRTDQTQSQHASTR